MARLAALKCGRAKLSSLELGRIRLNNGWCSVSTQNIICCNEKLLFYNYVPDKL